MNRKTISLFLIIGAMVVVAFWAGVFYKEEATKFYSSVTSQINEQVGNFQNTEVGYIVSRIGTEVLTSSPLWAGGEKTEVNLLKTSIIIETNLQRLDNGNLVPLKENVRLSEAASAKVNDMFLNQYFEHISPSGLTPGELVKGYGYNYILVGENLILGNFSSEEDLVQAWMDSPGHRENILNKRYLEVGVSIVKGIYNGEEVWIGAQELGLPLSVCTQPKEDLKKEIEIKKINLESLAEQINDKKDQIDNTSRLYLIYGDLVKHYNNLVRQYNLLAKELKSLVDNYNNQVNKFNACIAGK